MREPVMAAALWTARAAYGPRCVMFKSERPTTEVLENDDMVGLDLFADMQSASSPPQPPVSVRTPPLDEVFQS
jgi:hypothetical protein